MFLYRKRFERAEKEYIEAKVALHQSTEHKELIAEHLCAVIQENEIRKAKKLEELMIKLNLTVSGDESSISPKMLVYQRTPTPRYEHWPQSPSASHSQSDTSADSQSVPNITEKHREDDETVNNIVTKLDTPCSDSVVSNENSRDPPDSSHDPAGNSHDLDSSSKDPQDCSHDPDDGSCDQNNIPPVGNVDNKDSIHDSQNLNCQANS